MGRAIPAIITAVGAGVRAGVGTAAAGAGPDDEDPREEGSVDENATGGGVAGEDATGDGTADEDASSADTNCEDETFVDASEGLAGEDAARTGPGRCREVTVSARRCALLLASIVYVPPFLQSYGPQ
jgi:hypothetical protein